MNQDDGAARSLLQRAGANLGGLTAGLKSAIDRSPKVSGNGGDISASRETAALLNIADKEAQKRGDQFIASEMVLLGLTDDKSEAGKLARENGLTRKSLEAAVEATKPSSRQR